MTSLKTFGWFSLLVGLAMILTKGSAADSGCPSECCLVELNVFDHSEYFGNVIRDGDRLVALRFRHGNRFSRPCNFKKSIDTLEVDGRYLGYDLRGEYKKVLVQEESDRDHQDIRWEFVRAEEESPLVEDGYPFIGYFRVKNGALAGWWIGLGSVEPAKEGKKSPWDQFPRAPLILVKDKKDAAEFTWDDADDAGP